MVAGNLTTGQRLVPLPDCIVARRSSLVLFTRADAAAMTRMGIIPEDATTELLHGTIVLVDRAAAGADVLAIGNAHVKCVERLSDLRGRINPQRCHVRSQ